VSPSRNGIVLPLGYMNVNLLAPDWSIAASLGRLGGDFGMILTELGGEEDTEDMAYEWEEVMRCSIIH
jgi:hypothetical protein